MNSLTRIFFSTPNNAQSWVMSDSALPFKFASDADAKAAEIWLNHHSTAIVQECARICRVYVWFADGNRGPDESNEGCAVAILNAFGVKDDGLPRLRP